MKTSLVTTVSLLMLAFTGCASLPPRQAVTDFREIAGTWQGTAYTKYGSSELTLTISPDGSATVKSQTINGTFPLKLENGMATWRAVNPPPNAAAAGEYVLYGQGAEQILVSRNTTTAGVQYETRYKRMK